MPEARNQNRRVIGTAAKSDSNRVSSYIARDLTPEQKAQRQRETEASYQAWLEARRARLSRPRLLRF